MKPRKKLMPFQVKAKLKSKQARIDRVIAKGPGIDYMMLKKIPPNVFYQFRLLCARNGVSIRKAFLRLMHDAVERDKIKRYKLNNKKL